MISVLYAVVLLSGLSSILTMPSAKVEDGETEQDGLFLGAEPMTEPAMVPPSYRRNIVLDPNMRDEDDGSPKIIIVSDVGLKGRSIPGLNSAFTRSLPMLSERSLNTEHSLKTDRRNTDLDGGCQAASDCCQTDRATQPLLHARYIEPEQQKPPRNVRYVEPK